MDGSEPPPQDDLGVEEEDQFPTTAQSFRFANSVLVGIPTPLLAVAVLREALPRLGVYLSDWKPLAGLTSDDADGAIGMLILLIVSRVFGLALPITLAYRKVLSFYDRQPAPGHQQFVSGSQFEPTSRLGWATYRSAGWLIALGVPWALFAALMIGSSSTQPWSLSGFVSEGLLWFLTILVSTKFGFVFVAAADAAGNSRIRSFHVAVGSRWRVVLATNMLLTAVIFAVGLIEQSVASPFVNRSYAPWASFAISVVGTFVMFAIVTGATVSMYRAVFPPRTPAPSRYSSAHTRGPQDSLD